MAIYNKPEYDSVSQEEKDQLLGTVFRHCPYAPLLPLVQQDLLVELWHKGEVTASQLDNNFHLQRQIQASRIEDLESKVRRLTEELETSATGGSNLSNDGDGSNNNNNKVPSLDNPIVQKGMKLIQDAMDLIQKRDKVQKKALHAIQQQAARDYDRAIQRTNNKLDAIPPYLLSKPDPNSIKLMTRQGVNLDEEMPDLEGCEWMFEENPDHDVYIGFEYHHQGKEKKKNKQDCEVRSQTVMYQ